MKKIFLGIMIGIICSGVTVYATYSYFAKDISFTPSNQNWNVNNVEDALNELYDISSFSSFNPKEIAIMRSFNNNWYDLHIKIDDISTTVDYNKDIIGEYLECKSVNNTNGYIYALKDHYYTIIDDSGTVVRSFFTSGSLIKQTYERATETYIVFPS